MDWLFYAYTTILGKSEREFWESTPRKLYKQIDIHCNLHEDKDKKDTSSLKCLD